MDRRLLGMERRSSDSAVNEQKQDQEAGGQAQMAPWLQTMVTTLFHTHTKGE
jgi:hypothetical protein